MAFSAVVRVTGAGRLDDFRERVRWLMVRDAEAAEYTEHHGAGGLEYRFEADRGLPFPAFATASLDFPELRVEAEWDRAGRRGRAVIENGQLVEQAEAAAVGAAQLEVAVDADGRLALAMVCREDGGAVEGYAACAERHTYFRHAAGRLELIAPDAADGALEALGHGFAAEWLWYDETAGTGGAFERARYAEYGIAVRGANLRAERLAQLRRSGEARYSTLGEPARAARAALLERWAAPEA